ncbi:MAG: hypothetical protein JXA14_08980 [Anaerolineae bacterium]|nr:hypothetical protein [Anaerolineae bacterium]
MARIKTRLPKGGTLILLWIGVIVLLGAVGWGIGWLVPRVLAPRETPTPTQMARPTATRTMLPVPTLASTALEATDVPPTPAGDDVPTVASPDSASEPSAEPTAAPVTEPTLIAEESEVVRSGDGLFQVCRRHCPERWPPDDDELTTYAQQVAELNGLSWPDPALSPGQILKMLPCPEK